MNITIPVNDYGYNLHWTLYQADGSTAFDLTGYDIYLRVPPLFDSVCTVSTASTGTLNYTLTSTDFTAKGNYTAKFYVTKGGTEVASFEYFNIEVL